MVAVAKRMVDLFDPHSDIIVDISKEDFVGIATAIIDRGLNAYIEAICQAVILNRISLLEKIIHRFGSPEDYRTVHAIRYGHRHARATLLHLTLIATSLEMVQFLLQRGADPDIEDDQGYTGIQIYLNYGLYWRQQSLFWDQAYSLLRCAADRPVYHLDGRAFSESEIQDHRFTIYFEISLTRRLLTWC